jgi:NAD(P)-dependent dehydrogenase (short-subunit alcohol dehydrogenase family)
MVDAGEVLGGVELLVNNAGTFPRVPLLQMTDEQWSAVLEVNLTGTFRCTQLVARRLAQAGRPGAVVNLSSVAAFRGSPLGTHYGVSKAAIIGFTRAASTELAPLGIRTNEVAPGLTDTAQPRDGMSEAEIARASAHVPLGAMATPNEIADVVLLLLSSAAGHITGQVLPVNGGNYFG